MFKEGLMLERIEISNYKSIAHASITFRSENVIVGPNGVGKSNLLDAINFLRDAATDGLDHAVTQRHGIDSIRRWSKTRPFNVSLKLVFRKGQSRGEYKTVLGSAGGEFSVVEEEGSWLGRHPFGEHQENQLFSFKRNGNLPVVADIPNNPFEKLPITASDPSELLLSQFGPTTFSPFGFFFKALWEEVRSCGAYSIYPNEIRKPQSISNADVLADDGTNLASIIRLMRNTSFRKSREALTSSLRQVLPIVSEIAVRSTGGFYVPLFRVKESPVGHAHDLNMSQISDGTLRMLGMLTAFYQPHAPARITLEEPEQMIHPGLLPILVDSARDYLEVSQDRQILLTTHSPNLLDLFDPQSIIGATYEDGISSFAPISQRQLSIIRSRLFSAGELLVAEGIFE